jgi:hypothetical protein
MDAPVNPVETACGHCFCTACIRGWLVKANTCPMCRAKVIEGKYSLVARFFLAIIFVYAVYIIDILAGVLGMSSDTEYPAHHDSALLTSYVVLLLMSYSLNQYTKDVQSLVVAKRCGVTSDALENILLVFILTGIGICLVPSFAFFSGATGVMGIVLIMPRAWDLSMGFSCLLLYVSYSMPALLKFMGNFVLSVLTGFPIIGAWLHSPLMAHAIVITMTAFLVRALLKGYLFMAICYYGSADVDAFKIYRKKTKQILVLNCSLTIYNWTHVLDTWTLSAGDRTRVLQIIEEAQEELARLQEVLSRLN